jgi:hypothetical protein
MAANQDAGAKRARDILTGTAKKRFPSDYLDKSLNEIKELLQKASGPEKRKLQTAKKLLEQGKRLGEKDHGE